MLVPDYYWSFIGNSPGNYSITIQSWNDIGTFQHNQNKLVIIHRWDIKY